MGYTHYWRQHRDFTPQEWGTLVDYSRKIVAEAVNQGIAIVGGCGDSGTSPEFTEDQIVLNGLYKDAYETFWLSCTKQYADYYPKEDQDREGCFSFCKTARKPYDPVVVTILVAANRIAPDAISISSDGGDKALVPQFTDVVEAPATTPVELDPAALLVVQLPPND